MDKVVSCVERIRVIRGVNYGVITDRNIEDLFEHFDLNEDEKKSVFEILGKNNIIPLSESEIPQKVRDLHNPPPVKETHKETDEQTRCADKDEKNETARMMICGVVSCLRPETVRMLFGKYGDLDSYIDCLIINKIKYRETPWRLLSHRKNLLEMTWSEQYIALLRFGWFDGKPRSVKETAQISGITEERVKQIISKALKPRYRLSKRLRDYLDA